MEFKAGDIVQEGKDLNALRLLLDDGQVVWLNQYPPGKSKCLNWRDNNTYTFKLRYRNGREYVDNPVGTIWRGVLYVWIKTRSGIVTINSEGGNIVDTVSTELELDDPRLEKFPVDTQRRTT